MGEVTYLPTADIGVAVAAPTPLTEKHDCSNFDCSVNSLNDWLRKPALKNQGSDASRTYVVCAGASVVGYYALASGSVSHVAATARAKRNMPNPVPVIVLGRLAVDTRWAGRGIGTGMLSDAMKRVVAVSAIVGVKALLVHAIDDRAKAFYLRHGLSESPIEPLTLMVSVREIANAL